jgi:hypothetical protein
MKVRILPSALADLERGSRFYERQGQGLGDYFPDTSCSDIDSPALCGGIHRKLGPYHRLLSRRFPFAIYYRVKDETVEVWRVLDCRQHPRSIRRALQ